MAAWRLLLLMLNLLLLGTQRCCTTSPGCAQGQSLAAFNAGVDVTRDSCCNCVSVFIGSFDVSRDSCCDCVSVRIQTSERCVQVIGEQASTPDTLPTSGSIRGIFTRLLLAVWGNGDNHIQYLSNAGLHQLQQLCTIS